MLHMIDLRDFRRLYKGRRLLELYFTETRHLGFLRTSALKIVRGTTLLC
jgi:hypothetical protein